MPNFAKENDESKLKKRKKAKKKKKHRILKAFLLLILIIVLVGVGLVVGVVGSILGGAGELPLSDFEINNFTTIIYDKNGNEYASLYSAENRLYSSLSEMSPYLPKAFIAIEDERFETHFGIDLKRTGAATIKFLTTGNSDFGGSTITQQLIKKATNDDDHSWQRKVREIVRAIQLEQNMSKNQIIELYMNMIYLGEGAYGVETASYTYFNKSAGDLTIAECALIAGLAQSPEGRNPYKNPESAKTRQETVLGKMLELGSISQAQYDEAMAQELVYTKGTIEPAASNSYFVDAIIEALSKDLQKEKGVTAVMAQKMIYSNGLKIYSTIDPEIQSAVEEVYLDESYFKLRTGAYDPEVQSAMVIIDYKNGNVVGIVGGAGEKTTLRGLNRATQSYRAPGSTIKPLATYAPGINEGLFTAASTFDDSPLTYRFSTTTWQPHNSYSSYRGLTSVRKAIEISSNIIAARAFLTVGATTSMTYLRNFGITSLTNADAVPGALALGGLTKGICPLEHAAAYATIANSGIYLSPKFYTKVVDRNEEVLINKVSDLREVLTPDTAYIVTDMMRDVVRGSEATGGSAALPNGMPVAGKTGTSNESKDRWFAGFTPYYVASVWVGYDQQKNVNMSGNPAAKIWKAVMTKVHANLPAKEFEKPSSVVSMQVCADSGLLATDLCRQDRRGDRTKTEIFSKSHLPTQECNVHVLATVCPESYKLANPTCLKTAGTTQIVCIDRHYTEKPSSLPKDFAYEVPMDYCTYHYCPVDEYGNFITEYYGGSRNDIEPMIPIENYNTGTSSNGELAGTGTESEQEAPVTPSAETGIVSDNTDNIAQTNTGGNSGKKYWWE